MPTNPAADFTAQLVTDPAQADMRIMVVADQVLTATAADAGKVVTVAEDGTLELADPAPGGGASVVEVTQAEYDALDPPDPDTLYVITDGAGGAAATAKIAASETTTSTAFTDLATAGPSVTVDIGSSGMALVTITAYGRISSTADRWDAGFAIDGVDPAGADQGNNYLSGRETNQLTQTLTALVTGLAAGSHTFKMRYRTAAGGTLTAAGRVITAVPL